MAIHKLEHGHTIEFNEELEKEKVMKDSGVIIK